MSGHGKQLGTPVSEEPAEFAFTTPLIQGPKRSKRIAGKQKKSENQTAVLSSPIVTNKKQNKKSTSAKKGSEKRGRGRPPKPKKKETTTFRKCSGKECGTYGFTKITPGKNSLQHHPHHPKVKGKMLCSTHYKNVKVNFSLLFLLTLDFSHEGRKKKYFGFFCSKRTVTPLRKITL